MTKSKAKIKKVMKEYHEGKLHSGSKHGPEVTNPKQAVAIAYSEAKKASHHSKHKDPKHKKHHEKHKKHHAKHEHELLSAKHEHSGNENKDREASIKQDGYKIRHTNEVREMMEEHMHAAANIPRHRSRGMVAAEGQDTSYTGSQRPTRKNKVTDLNHAKKKISDQPYHEVAEEDSIASYKRAGLGKNTGADDNKEDMEYSRKVKVGAKHKAHHKKKKK